MIAENNLITEFRNGVQLAIVLYLYREVVVVDNDDLLDTAIIIAVRHGNNLIAAGRVLIKVSLGFFFCTGIVV